MFCTAKNSWENLQIILSMGCFWMTSVTVQLPLIAPTHFHEISSFLQSCSMIHIMSFCHKSRRNWSCSQNNASTTISFLSHGKIKEDWLPCVQMLKSSKATMRNQEVFFVLSTFTMTKCFGNIVLGHHLINHVKTIKKSIASHRSHPKWGSDVGVKISTNSQIPIPALISDHFLHFHQDKMFWKHCVGSSFDHSCQNNKKKHCITQFTP